MKKFKNILVILIFFLILFITNKVQADNYSIKEIDMQVTVQEDGSLQIDQTLKYNFSGSYNGIYITIPSGVDDEKYDEVRKQTSIVNDSFYNASDVQVNKVSVSGKKFTKVGSARNGQDGVYTIEQTEGLKKIKVYSPTSNSTKTFFVSYTLKNVAVKHKDIGEIYYNFIGGAWDKTIEKLNIDINLPNNTSKDNLYAFAHGPENGKVTIVDKNNVNLYVEGVKSGEYVAGRVLFDLSNISKSKKESNKIALSTIMQEEENIYNKVAEKDEFNNKLLKLSGILLIYWLILILKYEKDKEYDVSSLDEEMFNKYNPLLAGCIQGNRNVLSRDIIAVILDLVNKKYLKLDINAGNIKSKTENYNYKLIINQDNKEYKLDKIEKYIVDWLFYRAPVEDDGTKKIDLLQRLEELPKDNIADIKFQELDMMTMRHLNKIGANKAKVPFILRCLNVFIFIVTIILSIKNIINVFDTNWLNNTVFQAIILYIFCLFPIFMYILLIPIKLLSVARKSVNKIVQKVNGQKVVSTAISIIIIFLILMIITAIFTRNKYLLACEVLVCIGTLIMLTDNLMLKNDPIIAEDYSRLNALKYKIENYSMMEDRQIKEIVLWERYLTYAISFGIASKITNKIKPMINDEDLNRIIYNTMVYDYVINDYNHFDIYMKNGFVEGMSNMASKMSSNYGSFSSGRGGGFSGGGRFSGGGGRGRRRRSLLSNDIYKDMEKYFYILFNLLKIC